MVVLAVLALALGLVLTHGPVRSPITDLRAAAGALAGEMRQARAGAIDGDHDVVFTLDAARRDYGVRGGPRHPLPNALELTAPMPPVVFHADGSASGGAVVLAESGRQLGIRVDWLTGAVTVR